VRIHELYFPRFGPFAGVGLDLSAGERGLHIVYGPNEHGKSTALRGLRNLLWGWPSERTANADDFRHARDKLRVGAAIVDEDGRELAFLRRRGRKNTLHAATQAEEVLDDGVLDGFLCGLSRDLWSGLFGIDHDELVRGGREILAGEGEIGRLLWAAALGSATLQRTLDGLQEEMEEFFAPRARKRLFNEAMGRYKQAQADLRATTLSSESWQRLREERDAAESAARDVCERLARQTAARQQAARLLDALPRAELLAMRRADLAACGDVPELHAKFGDERREAERGLGDARATARAHAEEIESIERYLAELEIPDALVEHVSVIEDLHSRVKKYEDDRAEAERLSREEAALSARVEHLLAELRPGVVPSADEMEPLRIAPERRKTALRSARECERLQDEQAAIEADVERQRIDLEAIEAELAAIDVVPDPGDLVAVLESLSGGDSQERLADVRAQRTALDEQVAVDLAALAHFTGSFADLEAARVPSSETVERFEADLTALDARHAALERDADAERDRCEQSAAELTALERGGAVPSEEDLAAARERREAGWNLVRDDWLEGDADADERDAFCAGLPLEAAYVESVSEADDVADRLRREADRVAKHAGLEAHVEAARRRLETLREKLGATEAAREATLADWRAAWGGVCDDPSSPREMAGWLRSRADLVAAAEAVRTLRASESELEKRVEASRGDVTRQLAALEPDIDADSVASLRGLIALARKRAEDLRERRRDLEVLGGRARDRRAELVARERDLESVATRAEAARASWHDEASAIGLRADATQDETRELFERIDGLWKAADDVEDRRDRAARVTEEADVFREDVTRVVESACPELADSTPSAAVRKLHGMSREAQKNAARRDSKRDRLDEVRRELAAAKERAETSRRRLERLCEEAGCDDPADLPKVETLWVEASKLREDIARREERLVEDAAGEPLDAFLDRLKGVDRDELDRQVAEIAAETDRLEEERSRAEQELGRLESDLNRADGSDAAAESAAVDAQFALAEIRDGAERWIRLRLAAGILEREIDRYRRENQAPILSRASDLFGRLTCGKYTRLQPATTDGGAAVVEALRSSPGPGGVSSLETVGVEGLSDGTRDQLYLALRLASLEHHLDSHPPMPFVVDDILVNFDDARAQAALEVLGDLAARTQVLLFTHHAHLATLAQRVLSRDVVQKPSFLPLEQLERWGEARAAADDNDSR